MFDRYEQDINIIISYLCMGLGVIIPWSTIAKASAYAWLRLQTMFHLRLDKRQAIRKVLASGIEQSLTE